MIESADTLTTLFDSFKAQQTKTMAMLKDTVATLDIAIDLITQMAARSGLTDDELKVWAKLKAKGDSINVTR